MIVPHESKLSAIENAAEYWGCPIGESVHEAEVMQYQHGDGPLVQPDKRETTRCVIRTTETLLMKSTMNLKKAGKFGVGKP